MSRKPIITRFPKIWRDLDEDRDGILERFSGVQDVEFNRIHSLIESILDLRSFERIPDKYLKLLAPFVGHEWSADESYAWNRRRVRDAIRRHSYKGTVARVRDILTEALATEISIQDNASRLIVPGKQGKPGFPDCHFIAPNYNHDGAFVLRALDVAMREFERDFPTGRAAGEVWFYDFRTSPTPYCEMESESIPPVDGVLRLDCTTVRIDSREWTLAPVVSGE